MKYNKLYIGMIATPIIAGIISKITVPVGKPLLFWWFLGIIIFTFGVVGLHSNYNKQKKQ